MNNYRILIRQQLAEVRSRRVSESKSTDYGTKTNHKSSTQIKREQEEYARLERKFWSN